MDYDKKRTSLNAMTRNEDLTNQPQSVKNNRPGRGDKKLEGPNRPST
jgi:hypothetical protein